MPDTCCAYGCTNRRDKEKESLPFYRIPKDNGRRKKWINAIKRESWSEDQINKARICGAHFLSGRKNNDQQHPDYVPSVFVISKITKKANAQKESRYQRLANRRSLSVDMVVDDQPLPTTNDYVDTELSPDYKSEYEKLKCERDEFDISENSKLKAELEMLTKKQTQKEKQVQKMLKELNKRTENIYNLHTEITKLKRRKLEYKYVKNLTRKMRFYTGIDKDTFYVIFNSMKRKAKRVTKLISLSDHLFLVLIKIKVGLSNKNLAYRFNLEPGKVSKIIRRWLPLLGDEMRTLIVWPEKLALRRYLPKCFRNKYKSCVGIIDCTEIFIQRPLNLNARAQTWSNYKNHNTIKYLVTCTPAGAVSFISDGWGGRVSDKEITVKSGLMEVLERGDLLLADRGFQLNAELATIGVNLKVPAFTKGKSQLPKAEVDRSRQIANVRIHIERVIGRLRKFNIINTVIPISQVDLLDDIIVAVSGLTNLNKSVVPRK